MRCATEGAAIVVLLAGFDTTLASADTVNSPPNAPAVTIAFSTACGTAPAPTPVTDGAARRYSVSTGPSSRDCFLTVDAVRPGVPRIESTDYPDGEPVILSRTTGTVTLRPAATLFVQAVDRAGNFSQVTPGWSLSTFDNPAPQAHERGDLTGDGRADVTTVLDHGFGRTMVWNVTARRWFLRGHRGFRHRCQRWPPGERDPARAG